ncbi:DUF92 domain-containing protein [Salinispira pacifica]
MNMTLEFAGIALLLNGALAAGAFWRRAVTLSGAIAGFAVGAAILILAGWTAWFCLGAFFVTSTIASRIGRDRKSGISLVQDKGDRRDAFQVLANGGAGLIAALLPVAARIAGSDGAHQTDAAHLWLVVIAAAFAEANADTWSSEIGVLSRRKPVSIVNRRPILPGMSGGVSPLGFAAAAAGSALVAVVFVASTLIFRIAPGPATLAIEAGIVVVAGWLGSVLDSLLGATIQPIYLTPRTGDLTERRENAAGPNARIRGLPFVTNDLVNFLSTVAAAAAAAAGMWALSSITAAAGNAL